MAVDWYLVVPLLFTVLAIVLASVFVRLRRGEGERPAERPREPAAAEPAREGGPGSGGEVVPEGAGPAEGSEDEKGRLPVEEVGAGEEEEKKKEAADEQREDAAEPGPAAEPSPAAAESIIPRQPPAEPREPGHREDAESKVRPAPCGASPRGRWCPCRQCPPLFPVSLPGCLRPRGRSWWPGGRAAVGFSSKSREVPAKAGVCLRVGTSPLSPSVAAVGGVFRASFHHDSPRNTLKNNQDSEGLREESVGLCEPLLSAHPAPQSLFLLPRAHPGTEGVVCVCLFFLSASSFCELPQTVPLPAQGSLSCPWPAVLACPRGRDWLPPPSQPQQDAGPKV